MQGPALATIARQLAEGFDGRAPAAVEALVEEAVQRRGPVPAGSLEEMVHRSAGYRLGETAEAGG